MGPLTNLWLTKSFLLIKSTTTKPQIFVRLKSLFRKSDLQNIRNLHKTAEKMSAAAEVAAPSLRTRISRFWQNYLLFTEMYPLRTQCVTMSLFAGLGNFISQTVVEKRAFSALDWPSIGKFMVIGACFTFPLLRSWLWTLERLVPPGRLAPVKKVLIDQAVFAPCILASFIVLMGFVEGNGWEDSKERLKHDWVNVMISNYEVWPAAQFINFYFVPFNQRILFSSFVSLAWNVYLAYVVRQATGREMIK